MRGGIPDEHPKAGATEEYETDEEGDLELLWPDEHGGNEAEHPDHEADEIVCLEVGAFSEVVLHVREASYHQYSSSWR
jgi:hypothetical protein